MYILSAALHEFFWERVCVTRLKTLGDGVHFMRNIKVCYGFDGKYCASKAYGLASSSEDIHNIQSADIDKTCYRYPEERQKIHLLSLQCRKQSSNEYLRKESNFSKAQCL